MAGQYEVTVTTPDRKTPVLRYKGPADKASGFEVARNGTSIDLIYRPDDTGGWVLLDTADGVPVGTALTLHRQDLDPDLKPKGKPVSSAVG